MKSIVAVFVLATSFSAIACPSLVGNYVCPETNETLTVKQFRFNSRSVYQFITTKDGEVRTQEYVVGARDSDYTASCWNRTLRVSLKESGARIEIRRLGTSVEAVSDSAGALIQSICSPAVD
jgi:hypothetical protein